jgi:hypothetical protein
MWPHVVPEHRVHFHSRRSCSIVAAKRSVADVCAQTASCLWGENSVYFVFSGPVQIEQGLELLIIGGFVCSQQTQAVFDYYLLVECIYILYHFVTLGIRLKTSAQRAEYAFIVVRPDTRSQYTAVACRTLWIDHIVLQQHFPNLLELRQARAANLRRQNAGESRSRDLSIRSASSHLLL